jgi:Ca2+-binding EF-hand superfamily protein
MTGPTKRIITMNTLPKSITLGIIATTLSAAVVLAANSTMRGPLPFSAFDMNNNGTISEDEFTDVRAKRQAARAAEGRQLRNAANAPEFEDIDTDKNGKISKAEFAKGQAAHARTRKGPGMGRGMGRGMGMRRGMGRGNQ